MINKKRIMIEFLLVVVLVTMLCSLVSAVGISLSYHDLNYLKVGPGETKNIVFGRFQNTEDQDKTLKIELIEGGEIAELTDKNLDSFVIPAGNLNTPLSVKVFIPEEIVEGTKYKITIRYKDIADSEGTGMVTITESKTTSIPVLVEKTEETPAEGISTTWIIVGIIVILLGIIVVWIIMKNKSSEPSKIEKPIKK